MSKARPKYTTPPSSEPHKGKGRGWINLATAVVLLIKVIVIAVVVGQQNTPAPPPASSVGLPSSTPPYELPEIAVKADETEEARSIDTLPELLAQDEATLPGMDLARMNLLCAQGLPGAEGMDIEAELAVLDRWAASVKFETERAMPKFYANPELYEHSEGYFRILMLITVLQQDFEVRYNPDRIYSPDFTDCRDVFLHGLTQASTGEHAGGTCVSMPVAYVAVARRLGYPVTLVTTKEHVFARWDGPNERFNIEGSGQGLITHDDDYYTTWPSELSPAERASGAYLRSLTPAQELGLFMSARGYVLEDTGSKREATVAYAYAHMLDPKSIDNFDNLGRSVVRRLPEYPAVQQRPGTLRIGVRSQPNAAETESSP